MSNKRAVEDRIGDIFEQAVYGEALAMPSLAEDISYLRFVRATPYAMEDLKKDRELYALYRPMLKEIDRTMEQLEARGLNADQINAFWDAVGAEKPDARERAEGGEVKAPLTDDESAFADTLDALLEQTESKNPSTREMGRRGMRSVLAKRSGEIAEIWGEKDLKWLTEVADGPRKLTNAPAGHLEEGRDELLRADEQVAEREKEFRDNRARTSSAVKNIEAMTDRWFK